VRLTLGDGYSAEEAYGLDLFNPAVSRKHLASVASKAAVMEAQWSLNPASWRFLTQEKAVFYSYCRAKGIRVPELYALFYRDTPGWSPLGGSVSSKEEWLRFIERVLPKELVIKPTRGCHGEDVLLLARSGPGWVEAKGHEYSAEGLVDKLMENPRYSSFLFQERLRGHPDLEQLSGTPFLQTIRLMTIVDPDGEPIILQAMIKLIVGNNATDNYDAGRSGNLLAPISLNDGTLGPARVVRPGEGATDIEAHPDTATELSGFSLPCWAETCALVKRAAVDFLPLRTIGWDVALTPDGAFMLEGNVWWDPPNPLGTMRHTMIILRDAGRGVTDRRD
jgi:hypothetical protein